MVWFIDGFVVDQFCQCFVGEVWIDSCCFKVEQYGEVVWIVGVGGFNDDVGIVVQVFIDQMGLDCVNGYWCWYWQMVFGDVVVREYQQYGVVVYYLFCFIVQCFYCFVEGGFCWVECDIEDVGVIVFFFYCCQLFKIGVQQDW